MSQRLASVMSSLRLSMWVGRALMVQVVLPGEPGGGANVFLLLRPGETRPRDAPPRGRRSSTQSRRLKKKITVQQGQEMVPTGPPDEGRGPPLGAVVLLLLAEIRH